jgi:hypothetical protein
MIEELWKPVVGYEGYYEISNLGNVRSVDRIINGGRWGFMNLVGVPIKPKYRKDNHVSVKLHKDGKRTTHHLASLLLEAFVCPRPEGMQACHNDGNGHNKDLSNLCWDTAKGNALDRIKHGTQQRGETHPSTKLKEGEVALIKKLLKNKVNIILISKMFNISRGAIYSILYGTSHSTVESY